MSGPGKANPARVTAAALMALAPQALAEAADLLSQAERPGTSATRKRGQGHEIREIRPYAEGDDLRHLDAAATARTGTLQIRSFHEDRERSLMLIADFRRPMLWGTRGALRSVAAAEALVLAGWQAVQAGGAVGALALSDQGVMVQLPRPRARGMALVGGLLERAHDAALAYRGPVQSLATELSQSSKLIPRGAGVVLASGFDDVGDGLDAALASLRARGPLTLFLIEDAFETAPPPLPVPVATGGGLAWASFAGLAAERDARAAHLRFPGQSLRRLASHRLKSEPFASERLNGGRLNSDWSDSDRLSSDPLNSDRLKSDRLEGDRLTSDRLRDERLDSDRLRADPPNRDRENRQNGDPLTRDRLRP